MGEVDWSTDPGVHLSRPPLTGTQKPLKCAKRLGVRRLDAAFAPCGANVVLARAVAARKFQGGVKPPHSKVPSAQAFSELQIPKLGVSATDRR